MIPLNDLVGDPNTFAETYERYRGAYRGIRHEWVTCRALFHGGAEVDELIRESGQNFFSEIHELYLQSILLSFSRLTDRRETGGKENWVLQRLLDYFDDEATLTALEASYERVRESCEFAREWRNKVLAHQDLLLMKPWTKRLLPEVKPEVIEGALDAMHDFLTQVEIAATGFRRYEGEGRPIAGYPVLLRRLWEAAQWRQGQRAPRTTTTA